MGRQRKVYRGCNIDPRCGQYRGYIASLRDGHIPCIKCKVCNRNRTIKYARKNPNKVRASARMSSAKYRSTNAVLVREIIRRWKKNNTKRTREYLRKWRIKLNNIDVIGTINLEDMGINVNGQIYSKEMVIGVVFVTMHLRKKN